MYEIIIRIILLYYNVAILKIRDKDFIGDKLSIYARMIFFIS